MFTRTASRALDLAQAWTTPHGLDGYVSLVAPRFSTHAIRARVVAVEHPTADTVALTLHPNRHWPGFTAGQYTGVTVEVDGVHHTRCYSVCSSAHRPDGRIEITVKAHPQGTVSRHLVDHARPGLVVGLSEPQGTFTLPEPRPQRTLLISGGSGITPVLSMLRTLCDEGHADPVTFVHYCLTPDDLIAADELAELEARLPNVSVVRGFTDVPGANELDGFFGADHLALAEPRWREAETFVCGPSPLMDAVERHFAEAGLAHRVAREAFVLPQFVAEAGTVGGTLRFTRAGLDVASDGGTLLEQAERAGLTPTHGCRRGICHTCTRPLRQGTVKNVITGALTSEPDTDVQLCIHAPVGDVAVDL